MTNKAPEQRQSLRVRRVRSDEGERLREIARTSEGYWGYDPERIDEWVTGLDLSPEGLRKKEFYVADVDGRVVGWSAIIPKGDVCWLDDLGSSRNASAKALARKCFGTPSRGRELDAARIELEAERHATGLYEKMGARYVRDSEPGVWGRISPITASRSLMPKEKTRGASRRRSRSATARGSVIGAFIARALSAETKREAVQTRTSTAAPTSSVALPDDP